MSNPRPSFVIALLAAGFAYQPYRQTSAAPPSAAEWSSHLKPAGSRIVTYDKGIEVKNWPLLTLTQSFGEGPDAPYLLASSNTKFLLATVPDPQNSHYPIAFDRVIESLQRALEEQKYMLDRFWLPWDSEPGPVDQDFVMHEQHAEWFAQKQEFPGVLIFRSVASASRICIFVIGETPESGISRTQFSKAMKMIEPLSKDRNINILGPTFSGSISSLGGAIAEVDRQHPHQWSFHVVTGTATAQKNEQALRQAAPGAAIQFARLIGTDDNAIEFFKQYALQKSSSCDHIAFLTESGTTYARNIEDEAPNGSCNIANFNYPMQISRMRNAYGKNTELQALSQTKIGDTPVQGLVIPLKDEHEGKDLIPTFSPELRPISQEASLLNVLATISYSRIEDVGIVATDILDALFLGRMLKEHCPNVRPFILDSDLIYGHSSQNNAFDGMLIVTTYPLIRKPEQFYNPGNSSQLEAPQFSSAIEEGEYWATLHLLADTGVTAKGHEPQVSAPWLAVMGRDGIWPIRVPAQANQANVPQPAPFQSVGWKLFFALTTLSCVVFAGLVIYFNSGVAGWFQPRSSQPNEICRRLPLGWLAALKVTPRAAAGDACDSPDPRPVLTLACFFVIAAYSFVAMIEMRSREDYPYLGAAVCVCALCLLFAAVQCCWRPLRPVHLAFFAFAAVLVCLELRYFAPVSSAFVYRTLHVGNGVSPIVPIVLIAAALFWLACAHLNRIRLFYLFPKAPTIFRYEPFLLHAQELHSDLQNIFQRWSTGHSLWVGGIALILFFSLSIVNPSRIYSVENFRFEWIYTTALYTLCFGLLLESVRFLRAWRALHGILQLLERHRLCEAFSRLPNELAPAYLWRWGGGGPSFLVFAHFFNRLKCLSDKQLYRFDRTYDKHFQQLQADARKVGGLISASLMIDAKTLDAVNEHISQVLDDLVAAMSQEWGSACEPKAHQGESVIAVVAAAAVGAGSGGAVVVGQSHPAHHHTKTASELLSETQPIAEEMIALRFVELIAQVNHQLKNNLKFIAGGLILAVISLNSYPFEPHRSLTSILTIYFFAVSLAFLLVFMQMSRNKIISYLNETTPGKLDSNVFQMLSLGGLPFITVISSQFPSVGGFLFAWVKPALEALR